MKTLRLIAVSMVFAALFAVSAMAQTSPSAKIALISTDQFYNPQGGITKIISAYKRLNDEMKPMADQINAKISQFDTLKKSYDTLVENAQKNIPVKAEDVQSKRDQLQTLQTEIKRMQEDLKAKSEKREVEIMEPISKEIGDSLQAYAKQKGYTLVLDIGRMYNAQMVLYIDETTNITKEFITFYNAKPAGTATK
jgi:Skp family chaperone for outer membrane proteins